MPWKHSSRQPQGTLDSHQSSQAAAPSATVPPPLPRQRGGHLRQRAPRSAQPQLAQQRLRIKCLLHCGKQGEARRGSRVAANRPEGFSRHVAGRTGCVQLGSGGDSGQRRCSAASTHQPAPTPLANASATRCATSSDGSCSRRKVRPAWLKASCRRRGWQWGSQSRAATTWQAQPSGAAPKFSLLTEGAATPLTVNFPSWVLLMLQTGMLSHAVLSRAGACALQASGSRDQLPAGGGGSGGCGCG